MFSDLMSGYYSYSINLLKISPLQFLYIHMSLIFSDNGIEFYIHILHTGFFMS
jgi:hypothetical protein